MLMKLKKHNDAISSYKKAIEINDRFTDAYNNIGITYKELGMFNKAIFEISSGNKDL